MHIIWNQKKLDKKWNREKSIELDNKVLYIKKCKYGIYHIAIQELMRKMDTKKEIEEYMGNKISDKWILIDISA